MIQEDNSGGWFSPAWESIFGNTMSTKLATKLHIIYLGPALTELGPAQPQLDLNIFSNFKFTRKIISQMLGVTQTA